ncbi:MAG: hypothetical protein IJ740_11190 [Ruminococcus sp.]|nr:hypothetical protein [Ruminococcus sp.]
MEKIKHRKLHDRLATDLGQRILAIILAVIIWMILSITQYPTISKTISSVPVEFTLSGTIAEEKGLSALNYKDISVDVIIEGMNYEIGSYTASDLTASVDVSSVTKKGTYKLDIDVTSAHSSDKVSILSISPETVEVQFDSISSRDFELTPSAPNVSAADGYSLGNISCSPSKIKITGAENDLSNISKAYAVVDKTLSIDKDTQVTTTSIRLYDKYDNLLDNSAYEFTDDEYTINFPLFKKKTGNLKVDFTNVPDGFDLETLNYDISHDPISILTSDLEDEDVEDITIGSIALNEVDLEKVFSFELQLANSEISADSIQSVKVTFDDKGFTSKTFSIPNSQFTVINKPSGKKVSFDTAQLTDVTIIGPKDVISSLKVKDLTAQIDLSDVGSGTGSMIKNATVFASDKNNVWCYGTNEIQITIS